MAEGHAAAPDVPDMIAERDALAQEVFESQRHAAQLALARQALADQLATAERRLRDEASAAIEAARREREGALAACEAAHRERDAARAAQDAAEAMLARVTGSTAWRLTAPLRHAAMFALGRKRGNG